LGPSINVCTGINLEYLFSTIANDRHGAGTKAPLNVVANMGVQQGTYGDLRSGLPSQMVEMHVPVRALFVVDAPPERIQAVFDRRPELEQIICNKWAHMIARHPDTGEFYRYVDGAFRRVPPEAVIHPDRQLSKQKAWAEFEPHYEHGVAVKNSEDIFYGLSTICMLGSFLGPVMQLGEQPMMNPYGLVIAGCATSLSLPVLAFSRRYLHGEHMFSRFSVLSAGLLLGFNMVATAPDLEHLITGWGLFGFTSTFLIASYNDRPSVRNNATFAFAAYRVSDFALISALAFSGPSAVAEGHADPALVASCLLLAALFKSSQFPLTTLFARSMEGPTPTSALGYAGLSAHAGVVLLASTLDLWYPYDMARIVLATSGMWTALYGGLLCKLHADRKGALAYATASTLGLIYTIMGAGQTELALALAMGHATFRTVQVLVVPNAIKRSKRIAADLDGPPFPKVVPDALYLTAWALHRIDTDAHMMNVIDRVYSPMYAQLNLSPAQQWAAKALGVTAAGIPFTPVAETLEEHLVHLLPTAPVLAGGIMLSHYFVSIMTMRFLFLGVLNDQRYRSF
jgi:Na+-translocating membrane potential-generating system (MpsB)/Proton-conducting membrane transporter